MLLNVLERCCSKYQDFSSFNRRLEELYGANIYSSVNKIGEVQALTISGVCINDDVSFDGSNLTLNTADLVCNLIFSPCLSDNGVFRQDDITQAKRQVEEALKSEYNDKKLYAKLRCQELMCKDEKFSINEHGKIEDLEKITAEDLFIEWKRLLESAKIEIIALGNYDFDDICKIFSDNFSKIERKEVQKCETLIKKEVSEVREFEDSLDVSQCKLVMGFRALLQNEDDIFSTKLMVALFGGTPTSKLFLKVREELSLCYYCAASFNKDKGIIMVESGVEIKNLNKAKEEILKQLEEIQKGNFSAEELDFTKIYLTQAFEKIEDSLIAIDGWYISQALSPKIFTPKEYAERIKNVTRQQVIESAKNIKLDTIYSLVKKGGQE